MTKPNLKSELLMLAHEPMKKFCLANKLPVPEIVIHHSSNWAFKVCAYYRNDKIHICSQRCASPGRAGRSWSWPGGPIDRTPYGVVQHETGHHVDVHMSSEKSRDRYMGDFSKAIREASKERPLTNYCPNNAEWFAEMFRLFITNPDLLRILRPATYKELQKHFCRSTTKTWKRVLEDAPERITKMVENKIKKAKKTKQPGLL